MPRSFVIGNGNLLVGYDANYDVRDLFFPYVGMENQTVGNVCRTGFWIDGKFAWVGDPAWKRQIGYWGDTLVGDVTLTHPDLGLTVHFEDYVDMVRDYFIRNLRLTVSQPAEQVRVFFHHDWWIRESDLGCTVLYEPDHRALIAYKGDRWALAGGTTGKDFGISSWATGKKGENAQGTWVDAEDGVLGRNPIDQGSIDSTVAFDLGSIATGEERRLSHWLLFGKNLTDVTTYGQDLVVNKGQHSYLVRTRTYWDRWSDKEHRHIEEALGHGVRHLFRRSVLTVRTQVDNRGGIVAANDYDITKFARDTYSYVWPRDGALVANALDRAGHEDVTRTFFEFCHRAITQAGFMAHKYAPDGLPGSSWHPWVDGMGKRVLPIQEDETGLVLWSLWQHYAIHRNLDFTMQLYSALVIPAAEFMAQYIDPRNGMVRPSWDLWEERWGVHAFTVGSVWAGLRGAANFAELYGDEKSFERFTSAAEELRHATDDWLWRPELDRFARRLTVAPDGSLVTDNVLDSAIYGLWRFGMYDASDPRIVKTMTAIKEQLSNKAETGGQARYSNDYYFQVERDVSVTPGNPWFICTLWLAQWYIAVATAVEQLQPAQDIIDWVVTHKSQAGMLSEQVDPHTGAPLSVAPLTWSHAEFMVTVDDYVKKLDQLRRAKPTKPRAAAVG
ncbi:MAG: glycoside hydrolase family 15 protein [Chloroflexi bacterium]|nr:MAG: glycoside hydrolase family 15 protein [Chloroflexota bacterium]